MNVFSYGYNEENNYKYENTLEEKIWIIYYPKILDE